MSSLITSIMPKKLKIALKRYLLKIKKPPPQIQLPSKNCILAVCKHPKTPSFALTNGNSVNNNHKDDAATLADIDRFLFENFRSLYLKDDENDNTQENKEAPKLSSLLFESSRFDETPSDLCGSPRFFVKPGMSGSLMEDALTTTSEEGESNSTSINDSSSNSPHNPKGVMNSNNRNLPDNCVALLTHSPSPYEDFKRSMQHVVDARFSSKDERVIDWDFMEELLFSYLNLNEKKSHKFILSAFVDLITVMRLNSETAPAKPRSVRTFRIGREVR